MGSETTAAATGQVGVVRRDTNRPWDGSPKEVISQDELFVKLYEHLPKELIFQRELLISRL